MSEVTLPVRAILSFPRDSDGLFIQPDELTPELAVVIEHNRERMASKYLYADEWTGNTRTVDSNGDYNCGGCNQIDGTRCLALFDDSTEDADEEPPLSVDVEYGSCDRFEIICVGDPELRANRLPASLANYGVRKGGSPGHVFGCKECPFAKRSKWFDSRNRPLWCGKGASTVQEKACCTINGAPTVGDESSAKDRSGRRVREWVRQVVTYKAANK